MTPQEIQEYRKVSAEVLGHKDISEPKATAIIVLIDGVIYEWQPDLDANQMLMVWDWIIDQGGDIRFRLSWWFGKRENKRPENIFELYSKGKFTGENSDIRLATAKAFMTYYKTTNQ